MDTSSLRALLRATAAAHGLALRFRADEPAAWPRALVLAPYIPAHHGDAFIDYQLRYFGEASAQFSDLSCTIERQGQWLGVWHFWAALRDGTWELSSFQGGVPAPLLAAHCAERTEKRVVMFALEALQALGRGLLLTEWTGVADFRPQLGLGAWQRRQLEAGGVAQVRHELLVDLSLEPAAYRAGLRKSYKALLSTAERTWQVAVLHEDVPGVMDEVRLLHLQAAGRATRSLATWQEQQVALQQNAAFLVTLRDHAHTLVGAGLFYCSRDESQYAIGVYNRDLFDQPLGHLVQWHAVRESKNLGLRWYRIGTRHYPADLPAPSAKELSIAKFKEGFATHTVTELRVVNHL